MKAAIIAAGKGERLARGGLSVPKPLVSIGGESMIARVIRAAANLKVTSIACIVNDLNPAVADYLRSGSWPVPLELVVKTTPSSLESLFALAHLLRTEPFLLFTVDAVFAFETLEKFFTRARSIDKAEGVLALTRFVDDDKPLWVKMDKHNKITAMGDAASQSPYVTAGFYYFNPGIFARVAAAREKKLNALRQFLGHLTDYGYPLYGVPVSKTIDVDYPEDLNEAEIFLRNIEEHG